MLSRVGQVLRRCLHSSRFSGKFVSGPVFYSTRLSAYSIVYSSVRKNYGHFLRKIDKKPIELFTCPVRKGAFVTSKVREMMFNILKAFKKPFAKIFFSKNYNVIHRVSESFFECNDLSSLKS